MYAHEFKQEDDAVYHHDRSIPSCDAEQRATFGNICLHLSALGVWKDCTSKPPPFKGTCSELMDEMLMDGFVTSGDPLVIQQPPEYMAGVEDEAGLVCSTPWSETTVGMPFLHATSLGYVKGMARSCTVLCMVHVAWKKNYDLASRLPKFYGTLLRIYAIHSPAGSKREIALLNMKLSCRGSIRKPPNVISILFTVKSLAKKGDNDFTGFLKAWNNQAARSHQVQGKKATSLKYFIEAPEQVHGRQSRKHGDLPFKRYMHSAGPISELCPPISEICIYVPSTNQVAESLLCGDGWRVNESCSQSLS